jgi:hypothetical protein
MSVVYDNDGNIVGEDTVETTTKRKFYDPEASAAMPLFRTLSLGDLDNLPDPDWVVDGIIPADAMVTVFGAPGSTKSFFALDLACSIASGLGYNGAKVKQGKVLYCVGEGLRGMKWRIEAWKLAHPDADVESLNDNLIVLPRAVMMLDKTESNMLVNTAEAINEESPLRAFVIDTWARSLTGGDENSAHDVGIAINVCETVRAKTNASPIIIHHTGADGTRERGSTALRGATDTTIQMSHEEYSGVVTVTCKKMKDGEPFAPVKYSLKPFGHSIVLAPITGYAGSPAASPVRDRDYYTRRTGINDGQNPFL